MKLTKTFDEKLGLHGVEAVTDQGFINLMWFDDEPNLDSDEWLDYLHEQTRFREEMWVQSGRFIPGVGVVVEVKKW